MSPRATPLSADERRAAILEAALPLLREHGRATTTRQIAAAAGIAEGTIFRVFTSKDELFDAAVDAAFDPEDFLAGMAAIDSALPLRERMVAMAGVLQQRFLDIFELMTAMAMQGPPKQTREHQRQHEDWRERAHTTMAELLAADAAAFRVPVEEVVRLLRLLTFSGSHPHISEQRLLTPDEIVDVVLHGVSKGDS